MGSSRGLDFVRDLHRDVECEAADSSMAAWSARMRRRRRAARRGGVVRRRYSGELPTAIQHLGTTTNDTGGLLTSLCDSGAASRRRGGDDGVEQRRWRARVPAARRGGAQGG
jgi:hypothetical protein